jgi:hypothetical protein
MWIATSDLPRTAAHPFYERINRILDSRVRSAREEVVRGDGTAGP